MSDDPMAAVLAALKRLEDGQAAARAEVTDLRVALMARMDRLQDGLTELRQDFQNARSFLLNDAAISGRRWLDLEERVSRLEREMRGEP